MLPEQQDNKDNSKNLSGSVCFVINISPVFKMASSHMIYTYLDFPMSGYH